MITAAGLNTHFYISQKQWGPMDCSIYLFIIMLMKTKILNSFINPVEILLQFKIRRGRGKITLLLNLTEINSFPFKNNKTHISKFFLSVL